MPRILITTVLFFLLCSFDSQCSVGYAGSRTFKLPETAESIAEYKRFCEMKHQGNEESVDGCLEEQRLALGLRWTASNTKEVENIHRYFGMCIAKNRGRVGHVFIDGVYTEIWVWDAVGTVACIVDVEEKEKRKARGEDGEGKLKQEPGSPKPGHGSSSNQPPAI